MKRWQVLILSVVLIVTAALAARSVWKWSRVTSEERAIMAMDQTANIRTTFWGKVVDQDGVPLGNVEIVYFVNGIDPNWALKSDKQRGTRFDGNTITDAGGNFTVDVNGNYLFIEQIKNTGYRWLFDEESGWRKGVDWGWNRSYSLTINGHAGPYLPDRNDPAVFVMVKDGTTVCRVKPSRGGVDNNGGKVTKNQPVWPVKPSLKTVRHIEPTTATADE